MKLKRLEDKEMDQLRKQRGWRPLKAEKEYESKDLLWKCEVMAEGCVTPRGRNVRNKRTQKSQSSQASGTREYPGLYVATEWRSGGRGSRSFATQQRSSGLSWRNRSNGRTPMPKAGKVGE